MRKLFSLQLLDNTFPALHGVRVVAILSVLQIHVTVLMRKTGLIPATEWTALSRNIFFGMDLFFILSGFLIGSILLRSAERKGGVRGAGKFYVRRLFRTVPLYWITLGIIVAVPLLMGRELAPLRAENLWRDFAYLTNYGGDIKRTSSIFWGWSLCVEEHFYLAVPVLIFALALLRSTRAKLGVLVAAWVAASALRFWIFFDHPGLWTKAELFEKLYIRTHARLDILVAGILLAFLQKSYAKELRALLSRRRLRAALYAFCLLCLVPLIYPRVFGLNHVPLVRVAGWGTITSLMYVPLVLMMINGADPLTRFLGSGVFRRIATLGYGVYLVHIPVCVVLIPFAAYAIRRLGWSTTLVWILLLVSFFALSLAVSYVLHLLVEKPMLALREKLAPSNRGR